MADWSRLSDPARVAAEAIAAASGGTWPAGLPELQSAAHVLGFSVAFVGGVTGQFHAEERLLVVPASGPSGQLYGVLLHELVEAVLCGNHGPEWVAPFADARHVIACEVEAWATWRPAPAVREVWGYIRVDPESGVIAPDRDLSLRRSTLVTIAAEKGLRLEPGRVISEVSAGRGVRRRPALQELLERAEAGEVSHLVFRAPERLSPDKAIRADLLRRFDAYGVRAVWDRR